MAGKKSVKSNNNEDKEECGSAIVRIESYVLNRMFIHIVHSVCAIVCRIKYKTFGTSTCLDCVIITLIMFIGFA